MYGVSMSPTLLKIGNVRIVIYTKDHAPAHVHAIAPGAEAKIEIGSWRLIENHGFSYSAIKMIIDYLQRNVLLLQETWDEIHNEE